MKHDAFDAVGCTAFVPRTRHSRPEGTEGDGHGMELWYMTDSGDVLTRQDDMRCIK